MIRKNQRNKNSLLYSGNVNNFNLGVKKWQSKDEQTVLPMQ